MTSSVRNRGGDVIALQFRSETLRSLLFTLALVANGCIVSDAPSINHWTTSRVMHPMEKKFINASRVMQPTRGWESVQLTS